jgi:hypothetical protein
MYFGIIRRKAKKRHKCSHCGSTIIPNQTHMRVCHKEENKLKTKYFDQLCFDEVFKSKNLTHSDYPISLPKSLTFH